MAFNQTSYRVDSAVSSQIEVHGRWLGAGGTNNCTKVSGVGISSVNYNAATGKYIITFSNVGATYLGCVLTVQNAADTNTGMKVAVPVAYSASAKTLTIDVADLDKALTALTSSDTLEIHAYWSDSSVP